MLRPIISLTGIELSWGSREKQSDARPFTVCCHPLLAQRVQCSAVSVGEKIDLIATYNGFWGLMENLIQKYASSPLVSGKNKVCSYY